MFKFENLHKNHKLALLDGLLCGIALTVIAKQFYTEYQEARAEKKLAEELRQTTDAK